MDNKVTIGISVEGWVENQSVSQGRDDGGLDKLVS